MATKKTFRPPDSQGREYTRAMLRLSRELQADVRRVLMPRLPDLVAQGKEELRVDTFSSGLAALFLELAQMAVHLVSVTESTLPGRFEAIARWNDKEFKLVVNANTGLDVPDVIRSRHGLGINVFRTEPFLQPLADNWIKSNTDLIKSLPTRLHADLEGIIRRGVTNGASVKQAEAL